MSQNPPKILFLSSSWLHGAPFGGQLRALNIGRALKAVGDVTVVIVSADANDTEAQRRTAEEFNVQPAIMPQIQLNRAVTQKLRWAFDTRYLNLHGCVASATDRDRLLSYFGQYDLVWVLNSRTANIPQIWRWPHAHLDVDDVPSTYLRAVAQTGASFFKQWKTKAQQVLMRRREKLFDRRFTTLSVCSNEDRIYLGGGDRIHVIPNGFARPKVEPPRNLVSARPRIGFIGLYSYAPNLDGVQWFLKTCWPSIRQAVPGIRFRLIGRETDGPLKPAEPDVDALGPIADPAAEIATWSAMVIPIRFGGGTRIKIADAFSRKCPVVSTRLGAFGYEVEDRKQLRLADQPDDFAAACIDLVRDPGQGGAMAGRAWEDFLGKWTWEAIAPKVWAAAEDCLRRSSNHGPTS